MAEPTKDVKGWSLRHSYGGRRLYVSGCASAGAAKKEMKMLIEGMEAPGKPRRVGKFKPVRRAARPAVV